MTEQPIVTPQVKVTREALIGVMRVGVQFALSRLNVLRLYAGRCGVLGVGDYVNDGTLALRTLDDGNEALVVDGNGAALFVHTMGYAAVLLLGDAEVTRESLMEIMERVATLVVAKNADYGDAWQAYGAVGVMIRLSDKAHRLRTLADGRPVQVESESVADTLIDVIGYCALGGLWQAARRHNRIEAKGENNGQGTV